MTDLDNNVDNNSLTRTFCVLCYPDFQADSTGSRPTNAENLQAPPGGGSSMSPLDIVESKITELMRAADEASAPSSRPSSTPGSRSVSRPSSRPSSRSSCDPRPASELRSQPCSSSVADGSNDGVQWDRRMLHPLDAARYGSPGCADSRDWMHGARSPYRDRDDARQQRSPRSAVPSSHYYPEDGRVVVSVADHSQASTPTSSVSRSSHSPCLHVDRAAHSPHVSPDSYMHSPRGGATYVHSAPDSRHHHDDSRHARSPKYRQVAAPVLSQSSPPDNLVSASSDRQACGSSSVRVTPGGATTTQHHSVDRCQSSHDRIDESSTSNVSPRSADSPQSDKMVIDETACSADSSASSVRFPVPSSTPTDSSRPSHTGGATFMDVDSQSSACSSEVDRVTQSNSRCEVGRSAQSPQPSSDSHGGVDSSQYAQYAVISSGSVRRSPQPRSDHVSSLSGGSAMAYSSSAASRMMYSALSMPTSSQPSHGSPGTSSPSTTPPVVTGTSSGREPSPLLSSQYETLTDEDD